MRILFDSKESKHKSPFGVLTPGEACVLRIFVPAQLHTSAVSLILESDAGGPDREWPFEPETTGGAYEIWRCRFSVEERGLYFYWFRVFAQTGPFRLFREGNGTNMEAGDKWQLGVVPADWTVDEGWQGKVMYQILPDRFRREGSCDLKDKLRPFTVHDDWYEQPDWKPDENGKILCNDFFGGNFRGIVSGLDYLAELGVSVLYLNPVGLAFSNHRYDTADYKRPDPMLGTEEDFRVLCGEAHRRGMRIILDGVYSHTGSNSVYFDREGVFGGRGAYSAGEKSPYYKWYTFRSWPDDYECWWNFSTLPNVTETDPSYMDYIFGADDSVIAKWLSLGADGIRLDVADELPDEFIFRLKRRLRELKPDALLLGEVWEDASVKSAYGVRRRYFTDAELDSVMNYPWRRAILDFMLGTDDGAKLGEQIMTLAENYPAHVLHSLMNPLGTHDTPRILTELAGGFEGTREEMAAFRLTPEQRENALKKLRLASFLQFTLPGCPSVYYGDEAGVEGCKDPFSRSCFPWGREDKALTEHYRALCRLKNGSPALRTGSVRVLHADGGVLRFERVSEGERLSCTVNLSERDCKTDGGEPLFGINVRAGENGLLILPGGCAAVKL